MRDGYFLTPIFDLFVGPALLPFLHPTPGLEYCEDSLGFLGELRFYLYAPN